MTRSKGFTLLELLLSATIAMFVIYGVYTVYKQGVRDQRTKETVDLVKILLDDAQAVTSTKTVFEVDSSTGAPHPIDMSDLLNARGGILEYPGYTGLVDGSTLTSPLGGEVTLAMNSSAPNAKDLVAITITRVPVRACSGLLSRLTSANVYDMFVNGNLVALTPARTADSIGREEVNMDKAVNLCTGASVDVTVRQLKEIHTASMRWGPYGAKMTASEEAALKPLHLRQEAALDAREAAQMGL